MEMTLIKVQADSLYPRGS